MAHMSGLVETLVQNQSQPLLLNDREQVDVIRARLQAERKKAVVEVATGGTIEADTEEKSTDGSEVETRNPRSRRNTTACKPAACTEGARPPVV